MTEPVVYPAPQPSVASCPRCMVGRLSARITTHTRIQNGMLISIPNLQVYECDVCGLQEFAPHAAWQLDALDGDPDDSIDERIANKRAPVDVDAGETLSPRRVKSSS